MKILIKWLGNVLLRLVFGAIGIFAMNAILDMASKNIELGINPGTMSTIGLLGVPGFIALYSILLFCK
ncbi:MAG: pro-sigmaK processing inhibitor BofA family protein [Acetivibrio sp.]